jgi:TolA-binding protein
MRSQTLKRIVAAVLLSFAVVTATAFACAWGGTTNSVRFHISLTERDLGRLPPLPTLARGINTIRVSWEEYPDLDDADFREEEPAGGADDVWDRAVEAEKEGKLSELRTLLQDYLERTKIERTIAEPTDRQKRRNSAIDRLDALSALDRGSKSSRVVAYLAARHHYDANTPAEIDDALSQIDSDVNLQDNVAYLRAAQLYREEKFEKAANAFRKIADRYAKSEKREAALFMAAVARMKASAAFSPTSGDEAHLHEYGSVSERKRHPVEIDEAWHAALAGFKRVLTQYPRGRYGDDARGWIAYLLLRKDDRAGALIEYYRLLADRESQNTRIQATFSLEFVRHHASDEELVRVERAIADEPEVALAYAYHNIYNYSIDPGDAYPVFETEDANGNGDSEARWRQGSEFIEEWEADREQVAQRQRERILNFSRRLMERYPKLSVGGAFALRAAQASVELGRNEEAAQFVRRALQSGLSADDRKQALWTFGVAEHRLKHFSSARERFSELLRDFPDTDLTKGARAHLAMIAEDSGDIDGALEQYLAMNYSHDVSYFIDVLMTPEQLAGFIERHQDSPELNELTYALGVRYLRANRWDEARATLAKVRTAALHQSISWVANCVRNSRECVDPKGGDFNSHDAPIISTRMIMRDVQTANDLERLERTVNEAKDGEAKAEAMYQLASYQYEATSLLFYNPIAWTGGRYWNLSYLASQNNYRATNESQTLFSYMQEHDTIARALKIYLEIVDNFPKTRAARDSLYTAAVCHERLAQYNDYWRGIYGAGLHAGSRFVNYKDVKAAYPSYQLPRGTFGWQPATRTVNDGPGWAAPPKPVPRSSRLARIKFLLEGYINPIVMFWNQTGRRGLSLLTIMIAMAFTCRIATQNRKSLRPRLRRVRSRNAQLEKVEPKPEMFWTNASDELWNRAGFFLKKVLLEFWELAQDANSRPVLVRNILSHSFLAGLILSLLWTVHFG